MFHFKWSLCGGHIKFQRGMTFGHLPPPTWPKICTTRLPSEVEAADQAAMEISCPKIIIEMPQHRNTMKHGILSSKRKTKSARTVGAKGRVFPEALTQSALAGGGAFFAGEMHGTFIKHRNLQHFEAPNSLW